MKKQDYTASITVNTTAEKAFQCINNVQGWWTVVMEGVSERPGDIFTVRFGETFITIKITEQVPGQKISWQVIDGYKHWIANHQEWKDTKMTWEITTVQDGTAINFTHIGLAPGMECYEGCENAWNGYIKASLFQLITNGKGQPELT